MQIFFFAILSSISNFIYTNNIKRDLIIFIINFCATNFSCVLFYICFYSKMQFNSNNNHRLLLILLLNIIYLLNGIVCQKNVCPRLLNIEASSPEPDRWYGTLTLISDADLSGVWLRMIFDRPSLQLGVSVNNQKKTFCS